MTQRFRSSRRVVGLALAAVALSASACKDTEEHGHAEIDFMRVSIAGQTPVLVNSTGVASGSLTIPQGVATTVTVEFLDANQVDALGETADEFQANVSPGVGITFARTGSFSGTLTGSATGTVAVSFAMFHLTDMEEEFGPFSVNVVVTTPPVVVAAR